MILFEMLSYSFLARAMLVGVLVSLCSALLGTSLVLKRYSMIGDGLSHVGFGALAAASALGLAPLAVAVPVVVVAAVILLRISQTRSAIKGDAAVALISSGALAIGVLVISLTSGSNTNISNYMFGSILTVSRADAVLSVVLCVAVIVCFTLLYPRIFAVTFDETFAQATGARAGAYNMLLAVLTAVTVVLGMRMMDLPAARGNARVPLVPLRHNLLGCVLRRVLRARHDGQLCAGDAQRCERGVREYHWVCAVCAHRTAEMHSKVNIPAIMQKIVYINR